MTEPAQSTEAAGHTDRREVRFPSGGTDCAAWLYPGTNGACVVMAAGFGVTKEPGTDPFARRFAAAGYSVLAFDYRHLGDSGGEPRQLVRLRRQLADWSAAIRCARQLTGVGPDRIAIWGFSVSGGHVFRVAARTPGLGAAIAHAPLADGLACTRDAIRLTPAWIVLRIHAAALRDTVRGLLGRERLLIPLTGPRGTVASLTTEDAQNGPHALNPGNRYPSWRQEVAASSALRIGYYRPGRDAVKVVAPLLVLAYDNDGVAPPGQAVRAAKRAPRGEIVRQPGGHYDGYMAGHARAVEEILTFLDRHVGSGPGPGADRAEPSAGASPGVLASPGG